MPFDEATGEAISDEDLALRVKGLLLHDKDVRRSIGRHNATVERPKGYGYVYPRRLRSIKGLSGNDWRVLFEFMNNASRETGTVTYSATIFGKNLDIQPSAVNRSMRRLVEMGLLERLSRFTFALVADAVWVGSANLQAEAFHRQQPTNRQENHQ
jgi:hypothetical protein